MGLGSQDLFIRSFKPQQPSILKGEVDMLQRLHVTEDAEMLRRELEVEGPIEMPEKVVRCTRGARCLLDAGIGVYEEGKLKLMQHFGFSSEEE